MKMRWGWEHLFYEAVEPGEDIAYAWGKGQWAQTETQEAPYEYEKKLFDFKGD